MQHDVENGEFLLLTNVYDESRLLGNAVHSESDDVGSFHRIKDRHINLHENTGKLKYYLLKSCRVYSSGLDFFFNI